MGLCFIACGDSKKFDAMGIFESDEILISSEISGKILDFNVKEGDKLTNGELLGHIDSLQLELKEKKIRLELQNALIEQKRFEKLYQANAGTKQNLDNANLKVSLLELKPNLFHIVPETLRLSCSLGVLTPATFIVSRLTSVIVIRPGSNSFHKAAR